MNQTIVDYLSQNKAQYPKETLIAELQKSGYPSAEINEAVAAVYASPTPAAASSPITFDNHSHTANYPQHFAWSNPQQNQDPYTPLAPSDNVQMVQPNQAANYQNQTAALQPHYAGFWMRMAAGLLDGIVISIAGMTIGFTLGLVMGVSGQGDFASGDSIFSEIFFQLVGLAVSFGYHIFMVSRFQATLGKMALGMRVYSDELAVPSIGQVCGREFGKILSSITLGIGYLMAAFTGKKQALHDMLAGTVVVYKESLSGQLLDANGQPKKIPSTISVVVASILLAGYLGIFLLLIPAMIVLVSLGSAREKAKTAAFKSTAASIVTACVLECDSAMPSRLQVPDNVEWDGNCHCSSGGEFSVTVQPTDGSIRCSAELSAENGAIFSGPGCPEVYNRK